MTTRTLTRLFAAIGLALLLTTGCGQSGLVHTYSAGIAGPGGTYK